MLLLQEWVQIAIDLPHPCPLPLGWQSGRPVGFWVNKHFLFSWQSGGLRAGGGSGRKKNQFSPLLLTVQLKTIIHEWWKHDCFSCCTGPWGQMYAPEGKGTFTRTNSDAECMKVVAFFKKSCFIFETWPRFPLPLTGHRGKTWSSALTLTIKLEIWKCCANKRLSMLARRVW